MVIVRGCSPATGEYAHEGFPKQYDLLERGPEP